MIAAIDDGKELHVVKWTGRVRLHAGVVTYCNKTGDAAEGVLQVPDAVFEGSKPYTVGPGQKRTPCGTCRMHVQGSIS